MKKQEPIPQEVIDFAELKEGGELYYGGEWQNFKVYGVSYPKWEKGDWGLPTYILYNEKTIRYADIDEID